jgi:hypothetical protein
MPPEIPPQYRAAANAAEAALNGLWMRVQSMQDDYFQAETDAGRYPRYLQLLWSHRIAPEHGTTQAADQTDIAPQDRKHKELTGIDADGNPIYVEVEDMTWDDTGINLPNNVRAAVSDYDGPQGKGWVLYTQVTVAGVTVQAERPWGPETYRYRGASVQEAPV